MIKEIWKDIKEYEGLYQVSNLGKIRSLDRAVRKNYNKYVSKGKILKQEIRNTYYTVQLNKEGKRKVFQVHRLVAQAFIPNYNNYPIVNHIDENPVNNMVENLEWCTQKYNVCHSKWKMYCTKNTKVSSKTNEKYINIKNNKYRVHIKQLKKEKYFSNIEEAIKYRNSLLPILEDYYKNYL